ncbi:DUF1758 domain-containing protein [Trichonephila clavipes]|nr:DUF1758 domain-containing protein [Trichonephila clavipes]
MLESLEYQVDPTSDALLTHMILFKLDPNSRTWFERTFSTDVIPRELSINAPVFSSVPISSTSEPSENSRVVDVTSCISDVNPDVQILLCTALIQLIHHFTSVVPIDVLLGVDLTLPLLKGQTLSLGKDKPFVIRSELGWIIGGKASSSRQNSFHVNHIQLVSDQLINKFWELDSVPNP